MDATVEGSEYYARNYPNYSAQNPPRKLAYYRRALDRYFDPACPRRIHDVGCAFGVFLSSLDESWEIRGSDPNAYAISEAKKRVPRGEFAVSSGTLDPLFPSRFGALTAFDVLEHVPDLDRAAEGIRAQLTPGGLLVFAVPVFDGATGPIVHLLDKDPTHVHKRSRRFWIEWMERHFTLLHWEGIVRYLLPRGYYLHLPMRKLRRHTPAILVVGRR